MRKEGKWVIGATIAAGIGYLAGLLSAPRSGKRTRKKLTNSAQKARTDAEKQLKSLYSELNELVDKGEQQLKKAKNTANKELKKQVDNAKKTRNKAKLLLSALHEGDAEDPDLKETVADVKKAKTNLVKFIKKQ